MNNSSDHKIKVPVTFISTLSKCLYEAVGDDIKKDIKLNRLNIINNSNPSRIWDYINRNIRERFDEMEVIANPIKRGPWELVPIFERNTGFIFSVMHEKRFNTLHKQFPKRRKAHYVDLFVRSFNKDLIAPRRQILLFPDIAKTFDNEDRIEEIVQKILADFKVPGEFIKRHALILFQSFNNELSSLRCIIVDSYLEIVAQADWSDFIKTSESAIVDKVIDKTSLYTDPTTGLKYTQKAKDKMNQKTIPDKRTDIDTEKNSQNS